MKRIVQLVTVALMLAAAMALSGVAQAAPIGGSADAKCAKLAIQTLGASFNPGTYTFIGGTEGDDNFTGRATAGPDVFCGFGGNDQMLELAEGDVFLGGAGDHLVGEYRGTDLVGENHGTFYGQEGADEVLRDNYGTFYGGAGGDAVDFYNFGTFYGEEGDDLVVINYGTFDGGDGRDRVIQNTGGTLRYVEQEG